MEQKAKDLRSLVERIKGEFESAQRELRDYEKNCPHASDEDYFDVKYDPIHHSAMTLPGDPPGTMGVDWRGPCYVPASTEERWKRECKRCGLIEYTTSFEEEKKSKKIPRWEGRR